MKARHGLTTKSFIMTGVLIAAFLIGLIAPGKASAAYPDKQIDLVIAFAAGATNDTGARLVADYLSKKWGVQIVVINKPGGNGVPAVLDVMTAKPDGYTLLVDLNATSAVQSALMKSLPYKLTDRTFICRALTAPDMVATSTSRPWKTLKDVADFVKSNPGDFKWGTLGNASMSTLHIGFFVDGLGVDPLATKRVDFKTGPEELSALAGGHIDFMMFGSPGLIPLVEAGKVVPIAATGVKVPKLPNMPTTEEAGFGWWKSNFWLGFSGPSNLPKEVIEKWESAIKDATNDPEFKSKAAERSFFMNYADHNELKKSVLEEEQQWKKVAEKMGISQ